MVYDTEVNKILLDDTIIDEFRERCEIEPPWEHSDEELLKLLLRMKAVSLISDSDIEIYLKSKGISSIKRINRKNESLRCWQHLKDSNHIN